VPFINEDIPDPDLKNFDVSSLKNIFGKPFKFEPFGKPKWTVDRERNAFLLYVGGGGGDHLGTPREETHALWWNGDVASFTGDLIVTQDESGKVLTWDRPRLHLPDHLKSRRDEFLALVREALDAKGWGYDRACLNAVVVDLE
jgi:hypothetical protein